MRVELITAHPHYARLVSQPLSDAGITVGTGIPLVLDFPQTFALHTLEAMPAQRRQRTVVVAQNNHPDYLDCLESYRVAGVVSSAGDDRLLVSAVYAASAGGSNSSYVGNLTMTERLVVRGLLQGLHTEELAKRLGVSPKTINAHSSNILGKTGHPTRTAYLLTVLGNVPAALECAA